VNLVFLGTPSFAVPSLEAVLAAGHSVSAVYTQPDRPRGRGQELALSPVKAAALDHGLEVRQPNRIRTPESVAELAVEAPDAIIVVGYGQILPQAIIDIPRLGVINVHASLLPKYRGAAPIQRSIAEGESITGVTTMKIDAGLDTGDMLLHTETAIGEEETAVELARRLAVMGADLLTATLTGLDKGEITPRPQDGALATYAPVLRKEEGLIDWNQPAPVIANRCRGFQPWPGCFTAFRDKTLTVFRCRPAEEHLIGVPGSAVARSKRLFVACGQMTTLELLEVQVEGRRRASAADFLNGQRLGEGEIFGLRRAD
jgi:methionyl-tRNA formyltransferase